MPCTSTGTIRRHPDILRLKRADDVVALAEVQSRLLDNAARLVAPGGVLVYCTCSLEPEEGVQQVERFLARNPGFARSPIAAGEHGIAADWLTAEGDLRTLPLSPCRRVARALRDGRLLRRAAPPPRLIHSTAGAAHRCAPPAPCLGPPSGGSPDLWRWRVEGLCMAELTLKDRLRKAAMTVDEPGKRSAMISAFAGPLLRWVGQATPVDHLLIVPQDLRTADPSFWHEMEHGQFGLAGSIAFLRGRSPFVIEPPSAAWARELHGFGWLRNLDAAGSEAARETGRRLALEWIVRFGAERGVAAEPAVAARRLDILAVARQPAARGCRQGILRRRHGEPRPPVGGADALLARCVRSATRACFPLMALAFATLSLAGHDRQIKDIETNLAAELAWQVLDDGGHVTRNPAVLVELLLDLLPLSQCFTARDRTLPKQLGEALERMLPMLRYLRLGDGMVARFNGMGCAPAAGLATVLAYDDGSLAPLARGAAFRLCAT